MKIYYVTKSKGRAGCANITYRTGDYASKAELRREYKGKGATVVKAYYESEMTEALREIFRRWA